jgi:carboxypeptidase Taq
MPSLLSAHSTTPYYSKLHQHFTKISHYNHLSAICSWDQSAMMPAGGNGVGGVDSSKYYGAAIGGVD